jgi:cytochrome c-type biogenesis protein CcmF
VARRATFDVTRDGSPVATMTPERRFFPVQGQGTTEAAIRTNWLADLYVVIGDPEGAANAPQGERTPPFLSAPDDGAWTVRAYVNPLAPWIWIGAIIMAFGGLISLSDRRHRVGAPARRRVAAPAAAE